MQKFFILSVEKRAICAILKRETKLYEKCVFFIWIPFHLCVSYGRMWLISHQMNEAGFYGLWTLKYSVEKGEDFKYECIDNANFSEFNSQMRYLMTKILCTDCHLGTLRGCVIA